MLDHEEEPMELKHDPVPGYRPAFFVAFAVGIIYLGLILFNTL
jgi:hypothetical protein